jgi:hypothetical protein
MLGLVRGMFVSARGDAYKRRLLSQAGGDLKRAMELAVANAPDSPEHQQAWILAESALEMVGRALHWNASLSPVEAALRFRVNGGRWGAKR